MVPQVSLLCGGGFNSGDRGYVARCRMVLRESGNTEIGKSRVGCSKNLPSLRKRTGKIIPEPLSQNKYLGSVSCVHVVWSEFFK